MKTLIFNGSPRINGNTDSLIQMICEKMNSDYKIVNCYRCNISPCIDCRFCWENRGCAILDEMQEVYDYIQECDNILIASPIYFSELTGRLLDVGSRLQTFFCARFFRNVIPIEKTKKGAVILVGGGDGHMDKAYETACTLLHHMNCHNIHTLVSFHNTNIKFAKEETKVLSGIDSIVRFFNGVS